MFGQLVKKLRLQRELGLREFCLKHGHDASNWSKMERGVVPPPSSEEALEKIAQELGIEKGSDQWMEFVDAAAVARSEIPADIMDDKELVGKLPLFFRTLRGQRPTTAELKGIAEIIRRG